MVNLDTQNNWIVIPARGGSRGIPRKNVRTLGNKPLILHVLEEIATEFNREHIIVTTDDSEISKLTEPFARIHHRSPTLANDTATLDQVVVEVSHWLLEHGASESDILLTVQPTSPFLQCTTMLDGIQKLKAGAKSVMTVKDDRHLRWTVNEDGQPIPLFSQRVNRQWQTPTYGETGGLFGAYIADIISTTTRINPPISLLIVDEVEGLDIDSYAQWAVAEFYLQRKRIIIRADASVQLGMGHVYRAIALAHELAQHEIIIVTCDQGEYSLGAQFLLKQPYQVETVANEDAFFELLSKFNPQLVILDILDTTEEYVQEIKNTVGFVVSFEDLGSGSFIADLVINDLYSDLYPRSSHWYGIQNSILAPHFETTAQKIMVRENVETILVTFGGTDPSQLTLKALKALQEIKFSGQTLVVLGPGYRHDSFTLEQFGLKGEILSSVTNMALVASKADLAITSAGRTVTELMTLGIPMVVLCQNLRELRHTHTSSAYGVINLGLGQHVGTSSLAEYLHMLMDMSMRRDMHERAVNATQYRSNQKIVSRILEVAFQ